MNFLGIDASLRASGITLKSTDPQYKLIKPPSKLKGGDRLAYIYNQTENLIKDINVDLAVMEGPAYGAITKAFSMGEVYGIYKLICSMQNIQLIIVPPLQIKKYFTGDGSAGKKRMVNRANTLGYVGTSDDIADSMACSFLAKDVFKDENSMSTRAALEVVRDLRKKHGFTS